MSDMLAARIARVGGPISLETVQIPKPAAGEVLVRVVASEINAVDRFVISGKFETRLPLPFTVGRDAVGEVVASGEETTAGFSAGQTVWTNSMGHAGRQGTFSQYVTVPEERLYALPEGIDPLEAAAVLHTAATAYLGLFEHSRLQIGDALFVGGGGGGVGSAVVQIASNAGARVIASAREKDFAWLEDIGADAMVDFTREGFLSRAAALAPEGFDVWWETSGKHELEKTVPLMRDRGEIVLMAGIGAETALPLGDFYTRNLSLRGFAISSATVAELARAAAHINVLLAEGKLRARVSHVFGLTEAEEAYAASETARGRVVVRMDS